MTRQLATDISPSLTDAAPRKGAAIAQATSALLDELERSLAASQRALLSRDLEGLEQATCKQIALRRSLQILSPKTLVSRTPRSQILVSQTAGPELRAQDRPALELGSAFAEGLRAAEWRVLYLGRVQAALLTRAQRSLRIVSHRLAGSAASYAAPDYARPAFEPCDALPPRDADGDHPAREENTKIKMETEIEIEIENEIEIEKVKMKEARPCRV
jgi:hypothetical protein